MKDKNTIEKGNDSELVNLYILKGNKEAFGRIYENYFNDVYRFVFSRLGKVEWVEEVVSDTFFALLDLLKKFDSKSNLKSFIIGIALNKTRQFWSKNYKIKEIEFDEEYIKVENEPYDGSLLDNLSSQIPTILGKLPYRYKTILELRFLQAKSIRDTADELNITVNNVKVLQNRAIKKAIYIANNLKNENNK